MDTNVRAPKVCPKCGKQFARPALLRRHLDRKKPCDPILEPNRLAEKQPTCRYCGRSFTTSTSMYRHIRQYCKIANSAEGMEKLFERTLQRQLTELQAQVAAQNAQMTAQMTELTALLKGQLAIAAPQAPATAVSHADQVNTGTVMNTHIERPTITQNIVQILPWDGERRISVGVEAIKAAFAENGRLQEYARLGDHDLVDPAIAPPYVTELLMDLTKRAHADPAARNVYLNPRRADQALVHLKTGKWEVLPLAEATRLLFDGVAQGITAVSRKLEERRQLPAEAQNALAMAGLMYDDEPDEYAKRAKAPMSAHLVNTAPPAEGQ